MRMIDRNERGAVTAETAIVLPLLVVVAVALAWLIAIGGSQVRCLGAAREAARALARGEAEQARHLADRIAPPGAVTRWHHSGGDVEVTVRVRVRGPGPLLRHLPAVHLTGRAIAALEPGVGHG